MFRVVSTEVFLNDLTCTLRDHLGSGSGDPFGCLVDSEVGRPEAQQGAWRDWGGPSNSSAELRAHPAGSALSLQEPNRKNSPRMVC